MTDAEGELIEGSPRSSMGTVVELLREAGRVGTEALGDPGGGGPLGGSRRGGGPDDADRRLDPRIEWLEVVFEPISEHAR